MKKIKPISFRSIRFEMSALFAVILTTILLVFSGMIYWIISSTVFTEMDYQLKIQAKEISDNINLYLKAKKGQEGSFKYALDKTIDQGSKTRQRWWAMGFDRRWFKKLDQQDLSNVYVNFISLTGQSLISSQNVGEGLRAILKDHNRVPESGKDIYFNITLNGRNIRFINFPYKKQDENLYLIQLGESQEPVIQLLQDWMWKMLLSIPVIILLTSFLGGLFAKRILRTVEKISAIAQGITQEDLSKRVEIKAFYKEMNSLIDSFNEMISRLEKSFHHIRNFSSHIAHELKTPLTILRGETELALMSQRSKEEYQETLKNNLEEIQTMLKIIDDLLFFTRMEHHPGYYKFQPVELTTYMNEFYEISLSLASSKMINVQMDRPENKQVWVNADSTHLRRLFLNIMDNAIKFTPSGGRIDLTLKVNSESVCVSIKDYGNGLSAQEAEKIFDLFYSADIRSGGSGLGLTIAQAIAKAHGGKIEVMSQPEQGAEFIVTLPVREDFPDSL